MSRVALRLAPSLACLGVTAALASPAQAFLGFGAKAPAKTSNAAVANSPGGKPGAAGEKQAPVRKATAAERAASERMEPLARAAFWEHEVRIDPTDVPAAVAFSGALRTLGRYPEASQAAQQALVVDPKSVPALMQAARAEIAQTRGFYALDYLKRAQAVQPGDWRIPSLRGVALEQSERVPEARDAYAQALKLSPDNPSVLTNLALSYAATGEPARAEQLLRRAVAQPSAGIQERQNLALVLGLQGRIAEAERLIRQDLPPDVAGNNIAYLKSLSVPGAASGASRSWAGVRSAEATAQR